MSEEYPRCGVVIRRERVRPQPMNMSRPVPMWQWPLQDRLCRNIVPAEGDYCWQHSPDVARCGWPTEHEGRCRIIVAHKGLHCDKHHGQRLRTLYAGWINIRDILAMPMSGLHQLKMVCDELDKPK